MLLTNEQRNQAASELLKIVEQFNSAYTVWMNETGCRSTFGWKYGLDQTVKTMEVQGIDAIVYRKPPPDFQTISKTIGETEQKIQS